MTTCDKYKHNLMALVDIFSEMFSEGKEHGLVESHTQLFTICKLLLGKSNPVRMISKFITKTQDHWEKIYDRDLEYFRELGLNLFDIFENKGVDHFKDSDVQQVNVLSTLKDTHVSEFREILSAEVEIDGEMKAILNDERIDEIWQIFHAFVKLSIIHIHEKRKKVDGKYTVEFFPEISVSANAKKWNVKKIRSN